MTQVSMEVRRDAYITVDDNTYLLGSVSSGTVEVLELLIKKLGGKTNDRRDYRRG